MKVILTQEVTGLGSAGDVVEVKDGYGRNYLLPQAKAIPATKGSQKQVEDIQRARQAREIRNLDDAAEIRSLLESLKVRLVVRAGSGGRLFGSVTHADVVKAVSDAGGPTLDKRRVQLPGHVKSTGRYEVVVALHPEVSASFPLDVVAAKN